MLHRKKNRQGKRGKSPAIRSMITFALLLIMIWGTSQTVLAQVQTPLAGTKIPQFIDPLPMLSLAGGPIDTILAGGGEIELHMREFQANVMPTGFKPAVGAYTGTWVFGYINGPTPPVGTLGTYTGPVIVATREIPTQIRFINDLGDTAATNVSLWQEGVNGATDQTLHWADPLNAEENMCNHMIMPMMPPTMGCDQHYAGPIPAVPHLHGGYVPPTIDGGPDAWFTSDGLYHGHGYYSMPGQTFAGNECVYRYPNFQEAAPVWFHDHLLGGTRINVYCGLAGAFVITDPNLILPAGLTSVGLGTDLLIPLVIQDRMFDTNGQLYFPNVGINPEHPFWLPEFMGDTICVNGKVWPFLDVQEKRYRFLIINGSNARPYELILINPITKVMGPPIWQIGTDGGYLDAPVKLDPALGQKLVLLPGERADIIVDFTGFGGQNLLLRNSARAPYPGGTPVNGKTTARIIELRVAAGVVADTGYDPSTLTPIRTGNQTIKPLVNFTAGTLGANVTVANYRQLTLNEVMGMKVTVGGVKYPGGPLEVLVNNTKWSGEQSDGGVRGDFMPIDLNGITLHHSEVPLEGTTEIWEIINLTADTHPMHTHLVQCQILNRQTFNVKTYNVAYAAAFPGSATIVDPATGQPYAPGVYIPGFGPPLDYNTGNPAALGGNPDITAFLTGLPVPPLPSESGWKDTMQCPPGTVTRFVARFAPMDRDITAPDLNFQFDPFSLGYSYVWHCHIVDHEDNEMMRPYAVMPNNVDRSYVQGLDY